MNEDNLTLYTIECPRCKVLKAKLDLAKLTYNICNDIEEMKKLGIKQAPILQVNDSFLDFKQACDYIKEHK